MLRADVEHLQRALVALGYDLGTSGPDGNGVDGYFGARTRAALARLGRDLRALFDAPGEPPPRLLRLVEALAEVGWTATPAPAGAVSAPPRPPGRLAYADTLLERGSPQQDLVREAQRHLRQLGYLRRGLDGVFGAGTERAVRALQFDLLHTDDTPGAPVALQRSNQGRVRTVTGRLNAETAACIHDLLSDPACALLPLSDDPATDNVRIDAFVTDRVPFPFLRAILEQESGLKHFEVPTARDADNFIVLGLDTNDAGHPEHLTSRRYGVGQVTLFHHPPTPAEVDDLMRDVTANLRAAAEELRDKFDHFVVGRTSGTRADDRLAEVGTGPVRLCKYAPSDPRYLTDCRRCLQEADQDDIVASDTPWYAGAARCYEPTQYHHVQRLEAVPRRAQIGCDWPYAVRRYNGSGVNSYWYQAKVLRHVQHG